MYTCLLAIDIDGTLVGPDGFCSARNREAICRAVGLGAEVVLVTARPWQTVTPVAAECGLGGVAICSLGSLSYDLTAGVVRSAHALTKAVTEEAVADLRDSSPEIVLGWATAAGVRLEERYPASAQARANAETGDPLAEPEPIVHLFARHLGAAPGWMARAHERLGDLLETAHWSNGVLDLTAPGVTKLRALQDHCLARGIPSSHVGHRHRRRRRALRRASGR